MFKEFDIIELVESIDNYPSGTIGTIVHLYDAPNTYEVEFCFDNVTKIKTVYLYQIKLQEHSNETR